MGLNVCQECNGKFPAPSQYEGQQVCFTCYHWSKASEWLEKAIKEQRNHHPAVVRKVEHEFAWAAEDFRRSIAQGQLPLYRAHLPIRLVRLELSIAAANMDVVCAKIQKPPLGTQLLAQCESEILALIQQQNTASVVWQTICARRREFYAALRDLRAQKRLWDVEREQRVAAGL